MNTLSICKVIKNHKVKNFKHKIKKAALIVSIAKWRINREIKKYLYLQNRQLLKMESR